MPGKGTPGTPKKVSRPLRCTEAELETLDAAAEIYAKAKERSMVSWNEFVLQAALEAARDLIAASES